ncbi:MAG: trigger factor [Proteiniphilum sp.]|jgi:trigger factor|nr:trigger factor [Proteiniphilum sp.]NCB24475.1 trigger factor [Bacteroidia bacterium]MDD2937292.1 trigger factor [Proteiniphilum sp.]MDD3076867.1 trigger factor [Proteiniphilum sp.]MDD3779776.1 trigger factor [Proteiniphilum sp.]
MKSTLNKKDDVNGTIVIELEKADYQEKVDKSLNQFRQKANIPGFRQGKVPKSVIQRMYGKAVLVDEVNKLVTEELTNFIRENKLKILGEPISDDSEEMRVDLDKDEILTFYFDVALTPEFALPLDKDTEMTYYRVKLEDDLLEKQLDAYKQNYGTYASIEEEAKDTDLIKGTLTEMDGEKEKENGQLIENAILMPSYLKEETVKNQFIGAKVGDSIVFNPKSAYDNNEAEVASLLQTTKDHVKDINADFRFDIKEVTRYQEAELNQELFDRVLGQGVVTTEEEFRTKIASELGNQFKPNADHLFIHTAKDIIVEKMKDVQFPDAFLKRWLLESNDKKTVEEIEADYPAILEDLKFHIAKQKIVEEGGIKVEYQDIEALAAEVAKAQFAQYGMTNLPADVLQNYTKSLLEKEETIQNLYDRATEEKIIDWLKDNLAVTEKEISSKEFSELMSEHAHEHGENTDHHAEEGDNKEESALESESSAE